MHITIYVNENGKMVIHSPEGLSEKEALAQVYCALALGK